MGRELMKAVQNKVKDIGDRYVKSEPISSEDFTLLVHHIEGCIIEGHIKRENKNLVEGVFIYPDFDKGCIRIDFFEHYLDKNKIKKKVTHSLSIDSMTRNKLRYS
ncbi:MAG: hypothetical protein JSW73_02055, partial [Candidatus Woesearchaeota archaeon]